MVSGGMTKKPSSPKTSPLIESYTVGRVPKDMLLHPDRPSRGRYSPADVGKTSVNFWMPDEMLEELDRWRAARQISTRTGAVKQIVRWALAQPWPGGNAPPIDMAEEPPDPRVEAAVHSETIRTGPRGNSIDTGGISASVCLSMEKLNRGLAARANIPADQKADHVEIADLWKAAAKEAHDDEEPEPQVQDDMQPEKDAAE